ncbi:MAG: peptidase M16 [Methylophaga sp.]|nr:MAG: peptidase M16 [Methylophaga sp.]
MVARQFIFIIVMMVSMAAHAVPDIQHWQTSNGSRVYFVSAPELPMVDISVVFDAGSARDGQQTGIALLTNAMLNEGAGSLTTDQIAAAFDDVGARFSHSSERDMATLGLRTLTADKAMASAIATYTKVLTQPDFPQASFDRLRNQILIGLRSEKQSPGALAARAYYKNLFGDHPYASMPSGDEQSVMTITLEQLKAFYQQYYVAKNAVVVIVGALDKEQAEDIAEQLLVNLPTGDAAQPITEVEALTESKIVTIVHPSTQTHILMGQPGISRGDKDYFALYVGNHILGGSGLVSRLSNEIREKRGLSYSTYSYFRPMRQQGPYQFGLQTRNDQAKEALQVMQATLKDFIEHGPTDDELTAAKQNITGGFALRVDSNSKIAGYLAMISFYGLSLDYLDTFKAKVNAVTIKQIKDAYNRRIHPDKMLTVMVGGEAE